MIISDFKRSKRAMVKMPRYIKHIVVQPNHDIFDKIQPSIIEVHYNEDLSYRKDQRRKFQAHPGLK